MAASLFWLAKILRIIAHRRVGNEAWRTQEKPLPDVIRVAAKPRQAPGSFLGTRQSRSKADSIQGRATPAAEVLTASRLLQEQIRLLYHQLPLSTGASLALATLVALFFGMRHAAPAVLTWLAAHVAVALYRLILARQFARRQPAAGELSPWRYAYLFGSTATGLAWAATLQLTGNAALDSDVLFVGIVLAGVAAGALTTMASYLPAYVSLTVPILVAFALWSLVGLERPHTELFAASGLYLAVLLSAARRLQNDLAETVRLGLQQQHLLQSLEQEHQALRQAQHQLLAEQQLAGHVMASIIEPGSQFSRGLRGHVQPLQDFDGDVLLSGRTDDGRLRVLLGDATGHGLSAAIAAIPVAQTFKAMTRKSLETETLVAELNANLRRMLPSNMFMAAAVLELVPDGRGGCRARIWNGGLDDLLLVRADRQVELIPSRNLALGILDQDWLDPVFSELQLAAEDRLYAYTDGVTETQNPAGEPFGRQRLQQALLATPPGTDPFDQALAQLADFRGGRAAPDDLTLIEIDPGAVAAWLRADPRQRTDESTASPQRAVR
jgi:serine phosphatase RsbU (regulator of sigma subunit)